MAHRSAFDDLRMAPILDRSFASGRPSLDISKYLNWGVASSPAFLREWVGDESLRSVWTGGLRKLVARQVESIAFARNYAEQCPCPRATLDAYKPRRIRLGQGLEVLAGIHFDSRFFVNVYAQSRLANTNELHGMMDHLIEEFSVFEPMGGRWWFGADCEPQFPKTRRVSETRLIVGHLPDLAKDIALQTHGDVVAEVASESWVYDDYVAMYERYFSTYPHMRGVIRVETRDALDRCAEQEALFLIRVGGEVAGLIAAEHAQIGPIDGWHIIEEILDAPFRGRGFAAVAQHATLMHLAKREPTIVFGTISTANQASLRTAIKAGRRDAGGWVTVEHN